MTRAIVIAAGLAAALGAMPVAVAADYPTRPVTFVLREARVTGSLGRQLTA